jgi:hypothetical protein
MRCNQTVHYCKADKKTGKPVIVTDGITGDTRNVRKWSMDLFDKDGYPVRLEVEFNNSTSKAKRQGATTILKVFK